METSPELIPPVLDLIPSPVWMSGSDSKWEFFNHSWLEFTGRALEQEIGQGWIEIIHPGDSARFVQLYLESFDSSLPFEIEYRMRDRTGDYRWISLRANPIIQPDGSFSGYLGYSRDVTDEKFSEESLRESRQRFETVAELFPVVVLRIDLQGNCLFANQKWSAISGYSPELAEGRAWLEGFHPDDRAALESRFEKGFEGLEEISVECRLQKADGTTTWVLLQLRPEIDDQGCVTGYLGALADLTLVKLNSEEQLKISRFESLGILAGGIAHDFNNLLTPILLNLSMAKSKFRDHDALKALLQRVEEAEQAALRARGLSQQLLTFAKGGNPVMKPVRLTNILEESVRFALHGSPIELDLSVPADLWAVKADVGQLTQVIQNIVLNASQAMQNHGTLRVRAKNTESVNHPGIPQAESRHVWIEIEDEGTGIPADVIGKVFDPYFSTRVNGNGLGLTTALSIIRKHSGQIGVRSEVGKGSIFSIFLPATSNPPDETRLDEYVPRPGKARLLIMDDEELILKSVQAMLNTLGYTVDTATDGAQALRIYREAIEEGAPYAVTLMDLTIQGGMGGKEAVAELKTLDPEAVAVVCSGYSNDPIMSRFQDYGFSAAIQKPFQPEELYALLSEVIES